MMDVYGMDGTLVGGANNKLHEIHSRSPPYTCSLLFAPPAWQIHYRHSATRSTRASGLSFIKLGTKQLKTFKETKARGLVCITVTKEKGTILRCGICTECPRDTSVYMQNSRDTYTVISCMLADIGDCKLL